MRSPMLIIALVIGGVAAVATFFFISRKSAGGKEKASVEKQEVLEIYALQDIYPHTLIKPDMVEASKAKRERVDPAACQSLDEVIDHVVLSQVARGEKLFRENVSGVQGQTTRTVVSFEVPENKRAYAILIDPSLGTGGLVNVGDWVDVLVIYEWDDGRAMCRTTVQNIQVVAVDMIGEPREKAIKESEGEKAEEPKRGPKKKETPAPGTLQMKLVLAVDPDQAQQIAAAQQRGEITVTIRNAEDHDATPLEPSYEQPKDMKTQDELDAERAERTRASEGQGFVKALKGLTEWQAPADLSDLPLPTEVVQPEKTVEIIRGGQRETVTVSE